MNIFGPASGVSARREGPSRILTCGGAEQELEREAADRDHEATWKWVEYITGITYIDN